MKKKIILIHGDPISINSEIIYKSWKKIKKNLRSRIYLIGNYNLLNAQFKKLKFKIKLIKVKNIQSSNLEKNALKIIDMDCKFKNPFLINEKNSSRYVINSLNLAHKLALTKNVIGIINCPINKKLLKKAKIGVTEFLAKKNKIKDNSEVMVIYNKSLSISPMTTHMDVKHISNRLNKNLIFKKVQIIDSWFKKVFKKKPKIGVLGLNPHNAELQKNSEEKKIIIPAISKLKRYKLNIHGPLVADTIFIKEFKKYDIIIGMYHDQILPSFKAIFKFNAINLTLGLKYLRSSPYHGTASNIIKKNKADEISLLNCIRFINKFGS